jgi:hypothetical protein
MRRKNHLIYSLTALIILVAVVTGCKRFLDVNKNLNDPTAVPVSLLLSNCERNIASILRWGQASVALCLFIHTKPQAV